MQIVLKLLAKLLTNSPEMLPRVMSYLLGFGFFYGFKKRRRVILSNLKHAFPEKSDEEIQRLGRTSSVRMVEMSLLSFCGGYFSTKRVLKCLTVSKSAREFSESKRDSKQPVIYLVPHFTLMEMLPWLQTVLPSEKEREITCIYRSLNQQALENHIKKSRESHGMHFRARKEGFVECMQSLRNGGQVSILFDQNSRKSGALVLFMGRLCAATDLPGILAKKYKAELRMLWVKRTAFWRGEVCIEQFPEAWAESPQTVTAGSQLWLENYLKQDPREIPNWLWSHNRWRTEISPQTRFSLQNSKNWLKKSAEMAGAPEIPRKTRILMNLPSDRDACQSLLPVLKSIHASRPDMAFWLMGPADILEDSSLKALAKREIPYSSTHEAFSIISYLKQEYLDTICDWDPESPFSNKWQRSACSQVLGWQPRSGRNESYHYTIESPKERCGTDALFKFFAQNCGLEME